MESLLSQHLMEKAVMEGLPHTSIPCRQGGREEGERERRRERCREEREGGRITATESVVDYT